MALGMSAAGASGRRKRQENAARASDGHLAEGFPGGAVDSR